MSAVETLPGSPWIRRLPLRTPTLPPATHTNCWIVGRGELAVIDPASPYPEERAALDAFLDGERAAGARVKEILLTHHHVDHVSGAAHLARRLGVPVAAHRETRRLLAGRVEIARLLDEGDRVRLRDGAEEIQLEVLFTPGHAPGHLCYREPVSQAIVVGDMVASVGTIVIDPPEGEMARYLVELTRLRALAPRWLLPAHGGAIGDPDRLLAHYVAHRLERERKVVDALAQGAAPVAALVPRAYPELAPALYPLAARSLYAHLLKLAQEGRATVDDDVWRAT